MLAIIKQIQKLKTREFEKLIKEEKCFYHNVQCEIVKIEIYQRARSKWAVELIWNQNSFEQTTIIKWDFDFRLRIIIPYQIQVYDIEQTGFKWLIDKWFNSLKDKFGFCVLLLLPQDSLSWERFKTHLNIQKWCLSNFTVELFTPSPLICLPLWNTTRKRMKVHYSPEWK